MSTMEGGNTPATTPTTTGNERSDNNNRRSNNRTNNPRNQQCTTFKGEVAEMNGYIFTTTVSTNPKHDYNRMLDALKTYVTQKCKMPELFMTLFESTPMNPVAVKPEELKEEDHAITYKVSLYMVKYKEYVEEARELRNGLLTIYQCIWGQCTEPMRSKLSALAEFEESRKDNDCAWLLKEIKCLHYKYEGKKDVSLSLADGIMSLFTTYQVRVSLPAFYESFRTKIDVIKHQGGDIGTHPSLVYRELKDDNHADIVAKFEVGEEHTITEDEWKIVKAARAKARERFLAKVFLRTVNRRKYGQLIEELENGQTKGLDVLPKTITAAYEMCLHDRRGSHSTMTSDYGFSFAQNHGRGPPSGPPIAGTDGVFKRNIRCFGCNRDGHCVPQCPFAATDTPNDPPPNNPTGVSNCLVSFVRNLSQETGFSFAQVPPTVPESWILLDSQSSHNIFRSAHLLTNIRHCGNYGLTTYSNGGSQHTVMMGTYTPLNLEVWYNPESIANILSLSEVEDVVRVSLDSSCDSAFVVHTDPLMKFTRRNMNLYAYDTASQVVNSTIKCAQAYSMLNIVDSNKSHFSRRQLEGAKKAQSLYHRMGRPSETTFYRIISENTLKNCPVTIEDAKRAFYIFGPSASAVRGTTTRKKPLHIPEYHPISLPPELLEMLKNIQLNVDIFFVQGRAYLHTISSDIQLRTNEQLPDQYKPTVIAAVQKVLQLYKLRGFDIVRLNADGQFRYLIEALLDINVNIVGHDEHVGEVERSIRTTKERTRVIVHSMPYKRLPRVIVDAIIKYVTLLLNGFPTQNGACKMLSPRTTVTGMGPLDADIHFKVEFGQYCEVYTSPDPTNNMTSRAVPAIALYPTNETGTYAFMSLDTGLLITSHQWKELPITNAVIRTVEKIAKREKMPKVKKTGLLFEWAPGVPLDAADDEYDSDDDSDYDPADDEPEPYDEPLLPELYDTEPELLEPRDLPRENGYATVPNPPAVPNVVEPRSDEDDSSMADDTESDEDADIEGARSDDHSGETRSDPNNASPEPEPRRTTRTTTRHDYGQAHRTGFNFLTVDNPTEQNLAETQRQITGIIMTELGREEHVLAVKGVLDRTMKQENNLDNDKTSAKTYFHTTAVKKLGDIAVKSIVKEAKQLDDMRVYHPRNADRLTQKEKDEALNSLTFVTEKRDGRVKGRTCADGRDQRGKVTKAESASPTVLSESMNILFGIASHEQRNHMVADVAGAFLNGDVKEMILMRFIGEMVDYIVAANPEKYGPYVTWENGKKVLYVQLLKSIYGCMQSALIWYQMFTMCLKYLGYELNKYDMCVANKIVNGHQLTVAYYVDDLYATHKQTEALEELRDQLESQFGKMEAVFGDRQTYLGIDLYFNRENKTCELSMKSHIRDAIEAFEAEGTLNGKIPKTSAKNDLFEFDSKDPLIPQKKQKVFRTVVAKLIFISKRTRADIQPALSYLCTKQDKANSDDWQKLRRLMQYLKSTIHIPHVIGADSLLKFHTFVDVAYAVHVDMKSHTGGAISLGRGTVFCKSSKQKLNVKSSTEGEIVGTSDFLPFPIWTTYFLTEQGYVIDESFLHQDNMAGIEIEKNGLISCGQKSRHINVRYFFIKDRLTGNRIKVVHCPTDKMLADFLSKPLQGKQFRILRGALMGHITINELFTLDEDSLDILCQERVERYKTVIPGSVKDKKIQQRGN